MCHAYVRAICLFLYGITAAFGQDSLDEDLYIVMHLRLHRLCNSSADLRPLCDAEMKRLNITRPDDVLRAGYDLKTALSAFESEWKQLVEATLATGSRPSAMQIQSYRDRRINLIRQSRDSMKELVTADAWIRIMNEINSMKKRVRKHALSRQEP